MVRKRNVTPVLEHLVSAKNQMLRSERDRQKRVNELLDEMCEDISGLPPHHPAAASLMRRVELMRHYAESNIEEIVQRDINDAIEGLQYVSEMAAGNTDIDIGERIEQKMTEMIGDNNQPVNGRWMVPTPLVQQAIKDARSL